MAPGTIKAIVFDGAVKFFNDDPSPEQNNAENLYSIQDVWKAFGETLIKEHLKIIIEV